MDGETSQTIISGMGELHLEVYVERMRREYDVSSCWHCLFLPAFCGSLDMAELANYVDSWLCLAHMEGCGALAHIWAVLELFFHLSSMLAVLLSMQMRFFSTVPGAASHTYFGLGKCSKR